MGNNTTNTQSEAAKYRGYEYGGFASVFSLPMLGGNIVVLTQLYWPTVHPAMQEDRHA